MNQSKLEEVLERMAGQILAMDEGELAALLPSYKKVMDNFTPTRAWEKSVIIYFLINSVRVKNSLFQDELRRAAVSSSNGRPKPPPQPRRLYLVKPKDQ